MFFGIILVCAFLYFATGLIANIVTIIDFLTNRDSEEDED